MNAWLKLTGQFVLYGMFAAVIGFFSSAPVYTHLEADQAMIKVSFTHTAQRLGACRKRSDAELAQLPPNMRVREVCPRERAAVRIELDVDGQPAYRDVLQPSGLSRDGASSAYRRIVVAAGRHRVDARLSDNAVGEFNFTHSEEVDLMPAQILLVEFTPQADGLRFRR